MSHLVEYPDSFNSEAVFQLYEIVKAGELLSQRKEAAHLGWNIQGSIQKMVIGQPPLVFGAVPEGVATDNLESLLKAAKADLEGPHPEGVFAAGGIPWWMKPLAKKLAEMFLEWITG